MQASSFLDEEYVTRKILTLLGDGDMADEILRRRDLNEVSNFNEEKDEEEEKGSEKGTEEIEE